VSVLLDAWPKRDDSLKERIAAHRPRWIVWATARGLDLGLLPTRCVGAIAVHDDLASPLLLRADVAAVYSPPLLPWMAARRLGDSTLVTNEGYARREPQLYVEHVQKGRLAVTLLADDSSPAAIPLIRLVLGRPPATVHSFRHLLLPARQL
jgi:hypothetical protein